MLKCLNNKSIHVNNKGLLQIIKLDTAPVNTNNGYRAAATLLFLVKKGRLCKTQGFGISVK